MPTQMFVLFSVSNLGPGDMNPTVHAWFRSAGGKATRINGEFSAKDLKHEDRTATSALSTGIGPNSISGAPPEFRIRIRHHDLDADLTLKSRVPPFRMRNGTIEFGTARDRLWALVLQTPRADASGTVITGGKTYQIGGVGYMDHNVSTAKAPDILSCAHILRVWDGDLPFILQDMRLPTRTATNTPAMPCSLATARY